MPGGGYGGHWGWGGPGMGAGGMGMGMGGGHHFPGGSYWNNTGGWGNQQWQQQQWQQQRHIAGQAQYNQQMNQANQITGQVQSQALWENYVNAGQDLYRHSHGYGGHGSFYGGSPWAAGNIQGHFSVNPHAYFY